MHFGLAETVDVLAAHHQDLALHEPLHIIFQLCQLPAQRQVCPLAAPHPRHNMAVPENQAKHVE